MTRLVSLVSGMVIGGAAVGVASRAETVMQDPVALSPQYYTVKLDNDRVRVIEYRLGPGDKEPMHSHPAYVAYTLNDGKVRITAPDGKATETVLTKGQAAWREPLSHATENIGTTQLHGLVIELKR